MPTQAADDGPTAADDGPAAADDGPAAAGIGRNRAAELLAAAAGRRVLVVGDVMLDRYVTGDVDRISPEAPVPVVRVESERAALGGAANVAAGVAALGCEARLVAVVGADGAAGALRDGLAARGIDPAGLVEDGSRPTTVKTRILARHHQMLRVDHEAVDGVRGAAREALASRAHAGLEWAELLVLEDYDKGVLGPELARRLLATARQRDVPAIVDPKLRRFFEFRGAFVFKPNGRELAAALGAEAPPRDAATLHEVAERLACDHLLLTLGEEGMLLLEGARAGEGRSTLHRIASGAREVFDVTGAGDTVTAALAAVLAAGGGILDAARLANLAAGLEVSHMGAVPVGREELLKEFA